MRTWRPWESLRSAYWQWRAMERRCLAARKKLERRYLDLRQVVESVQQLDPDQGHLGAVPAALERHLEPPALNGPDKLARAFAILGKSFFRPVPLALQQELRRYAGHTEAVCREYEVLGARLRLAGKVIGLFRQDPSSAAPRDFHLALISPEAAWLAYQLRQRRRALCQANENCLARGWKTRMSICQRWLGLLHESMPSGTLRQFNRNFIGMAKRGAGAEPQDVPTLLAGHARLDLLMAMANRQATRTIAGLLDRKAD